MFNLTRQGTENRGIRRTWSCCGSCFVVAKLNIESNKVCNNKCLT